MSRPKSLARRLMGCLTVLAVAAATAGLPRWSRGGDGRDEIGRARAGRPAVRPAAFQQGARLSLDGGTDWINSAPIRLEDLKGKIVLLDFWTYCCINCHHVLPDLAKLEQKYAKELVVIGVHSPKFFAEHDTENIRRKVREYHIKHPVINDADQVLWQRFGVNSWPTLVVIDANGRYQGSVAGEGHYEQLDHYIGRLAARHRAKGELNESPIKFFPEIEKPDTTPLLFPGKVVADAAGDRLFVSDTGHHRIVVTDLQGKNPKVIGNGTEGLVDGDYAKAEFSRPQGMCLVGETLYVADTENHALRAVDLKAKTVTTVAGTGKQTHNYEAHGPGKRTSLTSPWDVIQAPGTDTLLIAMAGQHQIWRYEIDSGVVGVWAGSGRENIVDGTLREADFAQPSGLATDGKTLYVADSEVSGVRAIALTPGHHYVSTIVGVGLFAFADVDGRGDDVRLQHCLGLAYADGKLYIADTYNNKIKVCNPKNREVTTLVGNVKPGKTDEPPHFYQPGGLSVAKGLLYVADTNNSLIRTVDLKTKGVRTLEIEGLGPPAKHRRAPSFPNAQASKLPEIRVKPGAELAIQVTLPIPSGMKLNEEASMPYLVETPGHEDLVGQGDQPPVGHVKPPSNPFIATVKWARTPKAGESAVLKMSVSAFVCDKGSNLCQVKSYVFDIPVAFAQDGDAKFELNVPAK